MIDNELKIWAAGVFDGEGSALIERTGANRNSYQIVVSVANTSPKMAAPIMEAWGGHHRADQGVNKFYRDGSPRLNKDGSERSTDYTVYFSRDEAKRFLVDIYSYLRVKREEARIVLRALCVVPGEKELNRVGRSKAPRGSMTSLKPYYQRLQEIRGNH